MFENCSIPVNPSISLLVVDDEETVRSITKTYLEDFFHFSVDVAQNGDTALEMIAKHQYDAIVSDYEMEGMNGIALLRTIRDRGDDTPFIIFTGKGREEIAILSFENGADGYVIKGPDIQSQFTDMAQKILTIVKRHRAESALADSEKKFRDIYYNSPIAIEYYDEDGLLLDINPACCTLFGVESAESVKDFNLFADPNIPSHELKQLKLGNIIRYTAEFDFDLVKRLNLYQTSRSGTITLTVVITPVENSNSQVTHYLAQIIDISEQKQYENQLKKQSRFLDKLLETIPSPVFYKDANGRYIGCNAAFEQYIGLAKIELIGKTVFDIAPLELAKIYHEKDEKLYTSPGVQVYETQVRYADGTYHDVLFQKATIVDDMNNIQGIIGVMLDITKRKIIERELEEKETYIRTILDNLPIGVSVNTVEPAVEFAYYNKAFLNIYRITKEALSGPDEFWTAVYKDPVFREKLKNRVREDCAQGKSELMKWDDIPITRDGEKTTYISARNIPVPGKSLMISTVLDVTERKEAEKELRKANRLLEGILDGIPDIIGIQNPDHTMIRYNRAGYEALGLSHEDIVGKKCYSLIGRIKPCEICATKRAIETKKIEAIEKFVPELNRYLLCRSNPILDDSGEVHQVIEQLTDLTAQKELEESLRQSNQKLRFLTGLTRHDILNLLNAIHYYHVLTLETPDQKTVEKYITKAQEAGKRIEATIGFTREYEEFGVAASGWQQIYRIIESAKQEVSSGDIIIENHISPTLEIYADPIIRKVFSTILENAIRHGKTLTYIRFASSQDATNLIISAQDDGIGIPIENKERIFGRGYGQNTGIGLFLAKEILSITGLSIRERGVEGKGAKFEIRVPSGKWREAKRPEFS